MHTPPPPPAPAAIEHFISLGDRLDAVADARVSVPGEPTRSVSASLAHVPSQMWVRFSRVADKQTLLELRFSYLEPVSEDRVPGSAKEMHGQHAFEIEIGSKTGRVYLVKISTCDLSQENVEIVLQGVDGYLDTYASKAELRQGTILRSMRALIVRFLPMIAADIRAQAAP